MVFVKTREQRKGGGGEPFVRACPLRILCKRKLRKKHCVSATLRQGHVVHAFAQRSMSLPLFSCYLDVPFLYCSLSLISLSLGRPRAQKAVREGRSLPRPKGSRSSHDRSTVPCVNTRLCNGTLLASYMCFLSFYFYSSIASATALRARSVVRFGRSVRIHGAKSDRGRFCWLISRHISLNRNAWLDIGLV